MNIIPVVTHKNRTPVRLAPLWIAMLLFAVCPDRTCIASANPPERMTYQGYLVDANGVPLAQDTPVNYPVVFRIYNEAQGGTLLWAEQQTVTMNQGKFSVVLGEGTANGSEPNPALSAVFISNTASDRYIEITVTIEGTAQSIRPRLRLLPAPYSFLASNASQLVSSSGEVLVGSTPGGVTVNGDLTAVGSLTANNYIGNGAGLTDLPVNQISGLVKSNQIESLPANKITGQLQPTQIADLPTSKITSGTFDQARIPTALSGNRTFTGGNVGIGTSNPSATLEVLGTVKMLGLPQGLPYNPWRPIGSQEVKTGTATTDGFLVVFATLYDKTGNNISFIRGYIGEYVIACASVNQVTDVDNPITENSFTIPVPKNQVWKVSYHEWTSAVRPDIYITWIPMGQ